MLETWASLLRHSVAGQNVRWLRKVWALSPGTWIAAAVVLSVALRAITVQQNRTIGHTQQIAAAFGAANTFYGEPQVNHDGNRFTYVAKTETRGCALYLYDVLNQQSQEMVLEPDGLGDSKDDYELRAWPWAPDDSAFIYSIRDKLVIFPVDSSAKPEELTVGINIVSQVAWLTPTKFAFVEKGNILCFALKQDNGQWQQRKLSCDDDISSLTAVATNMVAWLQNDLIYQFNLDKNLAETTSQAPPATNSVPNLTISWSQNCFGFDNAVQNSGLPVSNTSAGLALASNWNDTWAENSADVQSGGVTVNNLFDSTGMATSARVTYAAWNGASIVATHVGPDADGSYNREMLNGYLNAGQAAYGPNITNSSVTLTGIPYVNYDVVVYFGSDTTGRHGRISDGVANYYFSTLGHAEVSGVNALFLPATQTNSTQFPSADFAFFPGLTNNSHGFACYPLSGMDQWLGISAVQVIQASNVYVLHGPDPARQIVSIGQPASFSIMAGGLNPCYQWRHAGINIPGATNAAYAIASTTEEQIGDYDVVVANGFSSVTGRVAALMFNSSKTIQQDGIGFTRAAGSTNLSRNGPVSKTNHAKTDDLYSTPLGLAQPNNPILDLTPEDSSAVPTNGLTLWLDASTLQQPDQTPVNLLADLSSSQNPAIEYNHPPTFNAPDSPLALNGRGTIHFSSISSVADATGLKTSRPLGIAGSSPRTVLAVMRRNPDKVMLISTGAAGAQAAYFGLCDQSDGLFLPSGWVVDNRFHALAPCWNILSAVNDGATQKGFVNGILKGASAMPLNTTDAKVELGLRTINNQPNIGSDGDFAELLIYDRALGTSERQQIEDYLARKWFGGRIIPAQRPLVWVDPKMSGITGFSYAKSTGQLLISVNNGLGTTLWRYDPKSGLNRLTQGNFIQDPQWIGGNEFAYIDNQSGHNHLVLADDSGTNKSRLFDHGYVGWFNLVSAGGKLLFSGTVSNEPAAGIWQYDLESGQLQSLVPYSDHPFVEAERITPYRSYINWPGLSWLIYPPATVDRHKKYPLVIADTFIPDPPLGPSFHSTIAGCGAYVAIVERDSWYGGIEQWGTNVLNLYQDLIQDPAIDPQQVYLFGASAETQYMSELIEKTPGLWKGIILLNPTQLPDFSKSPRFQRRPKVLISAGSEEQEAERFKQYQANVLKDGVMVEYIIAPGEAHRFVGKAAKLKRAEAVEHFIFEE